MFCGVQLLKGNSTLVSSNAIERCRLFGLVAKDNTQNRQSMKNSNSKV